MICLGYEGLSLKWDWIGVDELIGLVVCCLNCYMLDVLVEVYVF